MTPTQSLSDAARVDAADAAAEVPAVLADATDLVAEPATDAPDEATTPGTPHVEIVDAVPHAPPEPAGPGYLFVCGCPRSGTTAMWRLLSASRPVVIGLERYALRMDRMDKSDFARARFMDVREGDTFYNDLESFNPYYKHVRVRFNNARWVGDKNPRLFDWFDNLKAQFPGATVLMMFRNIFDVAASYKRRAQDENDTHWGRGQGVEAALGDWTRSLQAYNRHRQDGQLNLIPVCYERLLSRHEGLEELFARIDLPVEDTVRNLFDRMKARSPKLEASRDRVLNTDEVFDLCMRAPFGLYRQVIEAAP